MQLNSRSVLTLASYIEPSALSTPSATHTPWPTHTRVHYYSPKNGFFPLFRDNKSFLVVKRCQVSMLSDSSRVLFRLERSPSSPPPLPQPLSRPLPFTKAIL